MKTTEIQELLTYISTKKYPTEIENALRKLTHKTHQDNDNNIHLDIADFKTILDDKEKILFGTAKSKENTSITNVLELAIEDATLNKDTLSSISGILMYFKINPDFPLMEISEGMNLIYEYADEDADIVWSTITDESMNLSSIEVSMFLVS